MDPPAEILTANARLNPSSAAEVIVTV